MKIFSIICVLFLSGCAALTYNPATGRREFIMISTPEEVSLGQAVHQDIVKRYKLSSDKEKIDRINRVGQKLVQVSDRQDFQYHFFLIEENDLNAFTVPGGNIYFYTGLYDKLRTDDQIAAVLAHEIGHCAARHTVKKFQAAMGYDLIGRIVFNEAKLGSQAQQIAALGTGTVMNLIFSAYGRQDEYEADRLGVKYMYLAKFDLNGMIETFNVLEKESKGPKIPLILRTHPFVSDRIIAVKKEIQSVTSQFEDSGTQGGL